MYNRKEGKKRARFSVKTHYVLLVFVCLVAAIIGTEFKTALSIFETQSYEESKENGESVSGESLTEENKPDSNIKTDVETQIDRVFSDLLVEKPVDTWTKNVGPVEISNSRGVFADVYNDITSRVFLIKAIGAVAVVFGSVSYSLIFWVIISVIFSLLFWVFVTNVYRVVYTRIFLEARVYENVPYTRLWFLMRTGKWAKASMTCLLETIYFNLWSLTIVGGFIKYFSYFAVPYIVAENPDIKPKEAITLSRRMMDGHKWECFKLFFSFIGWNMIDIATSGLLGLFYLNPYKQAAYTDYYAYVREEAKSRGVEGSEALKDVYLYERASAEFLTDTYSEMFLPRVVPTKEKEPRGIRTVLSDWFGVVLFESEEKKAMQNAKEDAEYSETLLMQAQGKEYPVRLSPIEIKAYRLKVKRLYAQRKYSVGSLIIIFMVLSMIGWCWEVSLHLVSSGIFVNRGVMHGPWLPIYGSGAVLMLVCLYRFRKNPFQQFVMATFLCGLVEYFSGLFLELTHNGQRWWDYSGYFLNIGGRVCAEGLLVFGVGGVAIVYVLAPTIDDLIHRLNGRVIVIVCMVFLLLFGIDGMYSAKNPNTGKGITDYERDTKGEEIDYDSIIFITDLCSGECLHNMENG